MSDVLTPAQRRRNMQAIRGRDTAPEMIVRRMIHGMGFRYRLHRRDLPGCPDIVLPRLRRAILVHGCFWHQHPGCVYATRPAPRPAFWAAKLKGNADRDKRVTRALRRLGWRILVVWECQTRDAPRLERRIRRFLGSPSTGEDPPRRKRA